MRKNSFAITFILSSLIGLQSCSKEDIKPQNEVLSRPTIPIISNEVTIGTQVWMTKNLNVSRYRNGDPIPQVTDLTQWFQLTTGAWCYYQNNSANGVVFGKLYNWYAVNDPRGLAPAGYHIPSKNEWDVLVNFLGGTGNGGAGGKMKATSIWSNPNTEATNSSGFNGLPGGSLYPNNPQFRYLYQHASWWSSTLESGIGSPSPRPYGLTLFFTNSGVEYFSGMVGFGHSVRCIKN